MTQTSDTDDVPAASAGIIVFGRDEKGKAHASRFEADEAELAEKAAALMGMRVLRIVSPVDEALAEDLPRGRIFASGKGFVPFVKSGLFEKLATAPAAYAPTPPSVDEAAPKAAGKAKGKRLKVAMGQAAPGAEDAGGELATSPSDWDSIGVGSLVLACEGPPEGWYEAITMSQRDDDLFVLRWRDWPHLPEIVRRRDHLGLLPPEPAREET